MVLQYYEGCARCWQFLRDNANPVARLWDAQKEIQLSVTLPQAVLDLSIDKTSPVYFINRRKTVSRFLLGHGFSTTVETAPSRVLYDMLCP